MTKDELITEITGKLPYPQINNSLLAVRIAKEIYQLFEENYKVEVKKSDPIILQLSINNCNKCNHSGFISGELCFNCKGSGKIIETKNL